MLVLPETSLVVSTVIIEAALVVNPPLARTLHLSLVGWMYGWLDGWVYGWMDG